MSTNPQVFVVDDDQPFRDSLQMLFESVGLDVLPFDSAVSFLDEFDPLTDNGCLVLDIRMPGMSGLELQAELGRRSCRLPIIFMTGHGDVPMAVAAMKTGAYDFLPKPFSHQDLLDRVHEAIRASENQHHEGEALEDLHLRMGKLTPREHEVMELVVEGLANKVIANRLGVSQRTVEIHRAQVMRKMEVESLAALVRAAVLLGI